VVVDSCHDSGDQGHGVASPYFSNESHSAFVGKSMPLFLCLHLVFNFFAQDIKVRIVGHCCVCRRSDCAYIPC
jgi:hypothetical protein